MSRCFQGRGRLYYRDRLLRGCLGIPRNWIGRNGLLLFCLSEVSEKGHVWLASPLFIWKKGKRRWICQKQQLNTVLEPIQSTYVSLKWRTWWLAPFFWGHILKKGDANGLVTSTQNPEGYVVSLVWDCGTRKGPKKKKKKQRKKGKANKITSR